MNLSPLEYGLKEWNAVCHALASGRQIMLLRKGGIHEVEGRFEMEQMRFALFPTWLHQNVNWIKPADRPANDHASDPAYIPIRNWAEVTDIVRIHSRAQIDAIDEQHIYLPPLIDLRFSYKPSNPLYLLLLRAFTLSSEIQLQNTPAFAGCRSWVPFDQALAIDGSIAALSDATYADRRSGLLDALASV